MFMHFCADTVQAYCSSRDSFHSCIIHLCTLYRPRPLLHHISFNFHPINRCEISLFNLVSLGISWSFICEGKLIFVGLKSPVVRIWQEARSLVIHGTLITFSRSRRDIQGPPSLGFLTVLYVSRILHSSGCCGGIGSGVDPFAVSTLVQAGLEAIHHAVVMPQYELNVCAFFGLIISYSPKLRSWRQSARLILWKIASNLGLELGHSWHFFGLNDAFFFGSRSRLFSDKSLPVLYLFVSRHLCHYKQPL
jgi:hypothetical protein